MEDEFQCEYCDDTFPTVEDAEEHESCCSLAPPVYNAPVEQKTRPAALDRADSGEWEKVGKKPKTNRTNAHRPTHPEHTVLSYSVGELLYGPGRCQTFFRSPKPYECHNGACKSDCQYAHSLQEQLYHPRYFRQSKCETRDCKLHLPGECANWHNGDTPFVRDALLNGLVPGCYTTRSAAVETIVHMLRAPERQRIVLVLRSFPALLEVPRWQDDRYGIGGTQRDEHYSDASALLLDALNASNFDQTKLKIIWDHPKTGTAQGASGNLKQAMLQQLARALNDDNLSLVVVLSMSKQEHVMQATRDALSKGLWVRCIEFQPKCTNEHWQAAVQHRSMRNGVPPSTELFEKKWMPITYTPVHEKHGLVGYPSDWGYTELVSIIQTDLSDFRPIQAPVQPSVVHTQVDTYRDTAYGATQSKPVKKKKKHKGFDAFNEQESLQNTTGALREAASNCLSPPVSVDIVQRLVPLALQKEVRKAKKHWVKLQDYEQKRKEGTDLNESQTTSYQSLKEKGYLPQVAELWSQLVEADFKGDSARVEELQHKLQSVLEPTAISPAAPISTPELSASSASADWDFMNSLVSPPAVGGDDEHAGSQASLEPRGVPVPGSPAISHRPVEVAAPVEAENEGGGVSARFRSAKPNLSMWGTAEAEACALFGIEIESAVTRMVHEFGNLCAADQKSWLRKYARSSSADRLKCRCPLCLGQYDHHYAEPFTEPGSDDIDTAFRSISKTGDPTELGAIAAMYLPGKYAGNQRRQLADQRLQHWGDMAQLCYFAQNCRWFRENYVPDKMRTPVFDLLKQCIFARNNGIAHQNNSNKPDVTGSERQQNIKAFLDALEAIGVNPSSGRYKSIDLLRKGNSSAYMQQWMPLKFSNQLEDLLSKGGQPRKWLVDKVVGTLEMQTLTYRVAVVGGDMGTGKSTLAAKLVNEPTVNCAAHHLCSKKDTAVAFVKSICAQLDTRIMRGNLQGLVDLPEEVGFTDETCSPAMIAQIVIKYANDQITRKYTSKGSQTIVVDALNLCPPQMLEVLKLIHKGLSDISNVGLKLVCTTTDVAASKQTLGVDDNSVICIEAHEEHATDDVKKFAVSELRKKESYDGNPAEDAQLVANKVGCNFHHAVLFLEACAKSADLETIPQSIQAFYLDLFDSCCAPSSITATKGIIIDDFDETTPPEILKKSFGPMLLYMRQCESQSMVDESTIDRERTISILEVLLALDWAPIAPELHNIVQAFDTLISSKEVNHVLNKLKPLLDVATRDKTWSIGKEALQDWLEKGRNNEDSTEHHQYHCSREIGHLRIAAWLLQQAAVPSRILWRWQPTLWHGFPAFASLCPFDDMVTNGSLEYRTGFPRDRLHRGLILLKNLALSQCDLKDPECVELLHSCPENENVMLPSSEPFCLGCLKSASDCDSCIQNWEAIIQAITADLKQCENTMKKTIKKRCDLEASKAARDLDESKAASVDQHILKIQSEIDDIKYQIEQLNSDKQDQPHPCPIEPNAEGKEEPRRRESLLYAIVRDNAYAEPNFASLPQERLRSLMCLVANRLDRVTGGAAEASGDEPATPLNSPEAPSRALPALPTAMTCVSTEIVEMKNTWGRTALHEAVLKPSENKLQILLEDLHADPLATDNLGKNVMHIAAQFGTARGMEMLYESVKHQPERATGLLLSKDSRESRIPLHMAASYNRHDAIETLMRLHRQLHSDHPDHQIPLVSGIINERCRQFRTPLHWACIYGRDDIDTVKKCVQKLLSSGASVNAQDFDLATPMHSVITSKSTCRSQTLKYILDQSRDAEPPVKLSSAIYIDGRPFDGPVVFCISRSPAADGNCGCTREKTKKQTLSAKSRCPAALCGLPHSFTVPHKEWPSTTSDKDYTCATEASKEAQRLHDSIKGSTKPRGDLHRKAFPSLLMLASKCGDPDSIQVLLEHGGSVWALDSNYDLPIFAAIRALAAAEAAAKTAASEAEAAAKKAASEAETVVAEAKAEAAEATFKQLCAPLQETIMLLLKVMAQPESDTTVFTAGLAQGKARENPFIRRLFLRAIDSMKDSQLEGSKAYDFENAVKAKYGSLSYGEWPCSATGLIDMFSHFEAFLLTCIDKSSEQQLQHAIRSEFLRLTLERHATMSDRTVQHGHPFLKCNACQLKCNACHSCTESTPCYTPLDYCMSFFEGDTLRQFCSAMQQMRVRPLLDSLDLLRLPAAMNMTNCEGQTTRSKESGCQSWWQLGEEACAVTLKLSKGSYVDQPLQLQLAPNEYSVQIAGKSYCVHGPVVKVLPHGAQVYDGKAKLTLPHSAADTKHLTFLRRANEDAPWEVLPGLFKETIGAVEVESFSMFTIAECCAEFFGVGGQQKAFCQSFVPDQALLSRGDAHLLTVIAYRSHESAQAVREILGEGSTYRSEDGKVPIVATPGKSLTIFFNDESGSLQLRSKVNVDKEWDGDLQRFDFKVVVAEETEAGKKSEESFFKAVTEHLNAMPQQEMLPLTYRVEPAEIQSPLQPDQVHFQPIVEQPDQQQVMCTPQGASNSTTLLGADGEVHARIGICAFFARQRSELRVEQEHDRAFRTFEWDQDRFAVDSHMDASLNDFLQTMERANHRNIRVIHLGGHSSDQGFYWRGAQTFDPVNFAGLLCSKVRTGAQIECVFLNSCTSSNVAKIVIDTFLSDGVEVDLIPVVIAWASLVKDSTSLTFIRHFYRHLQDCTPNNGLQYVEAYKLACHTLAGQAQWCIDPASASCSGVPCLIKCDGGQTPTYYQGLQVVSEIKSIQIRTLHTDGVGGEPAPGADGEETSLMDGQDADDGEDPDEIRSMNNAKGRREVDGLTHLGFKFEYQGAPICMTKAGNGTVAGNYPNTVYIEEEAVKEVFGLSAACGYTHDDVWNPTTGAIVTQTRARLDAGDCVVEDVQAGVECLRESLIQRQSQAKGTSKGRGGKGQAGHRHMANQLEQCIRELENLC